MAWGNYGNYIVTSGMSGNDPVQSNLLRNCNLIAAMASCAWTGKADWWRSSASESLAESYPFTMYDYNQTIPSFSTTPAIPLTNAGTPVYARSTTIGESWPAIVEKAYYKSREWLLSGIWTDQPDLEKFNAVNLNPTSDPSAVLYHLLGRNVTTIPINTTGETVFSALDQICVGRIPYRKILYPAVAWTLANAPGPLVAGHTYSILGLAGKGKTVGGQVIWDTKYFVLRDPTVPADPVFANADDSLTTGIWNTIDFAKATDGIFAMKAALLPTYFQSYAYVVK